MYTNANGRFGFRRLAHLEPAMAQKAPRVIVIGAGKSLLDLVLYTHAQSTSNRGWNGISAAKT